MDERLNFGVHKVIWVFTDALKVMVADKGRNGLRMAGTAT